jgi:hypothetical protein
MGQQSKKVIKRRRRADYLKRKKDLAKLTGSARRPATKSGSTDGDAAPEKKTPAKKTAAKKAAKKAPAKKAAKKAAPAEETGESTTGA